MSRRIHQCRTHCILLARGIETHALCGTQTRKQAEMNIDHGVHVHALGARGVGRTRFVSCHYERHLGSFTVSLFLSVHVTVNTFQENSCAKLRKFHADQKPLRELQCGVCGVYSPKPKVFQPRKKRFLPSVPLFSAAVFSYFLTALKFIPSTSALQRARTG